MSEKKYTVELTFNQWMRISAALGFAQSHYYHKDMEGRARKFKQINKEIAEGLKHDG
jgi:hypothetical protein